MKIRKAALDDLEVLLDMIIEMYSEEREHYDPDLKSPMLVRDYFKKMLSSRLSEDDSAVFLAFECDDVVGFAVVYADGSPFRVFPEKAYIRNMFVRKEFRGAGIGSQLLEEVLSWADESNLSWIEAYAYSENNDGLDFWEKKGFTSLFTLIKKKIEVKN